VLCDGGKEVGLRIGSRKKKGAGREVGRLMETTSKKPKQQQQKQQQTGIFQRSKYGQSRVLQ
jgi:hypothetical protein